QHYIDQYFERYPGVLTYMESTRKIASQQGFVETHFGRRLYLPEINAKHIPRKRAAERTAINAPMQGTAADIIKLAMIELNPWVHKNEESVKMIMQVHDELVFEVAKDFVSEATQKIKNTDRKSTRLNSSHVKISYAVFCLKKKIKN